MHTYMYMHTYIHLHTCTCTCIHILTLHTYLQGFIEINTPKLIGGESEGGSEVFRTDYFGQVVFKSTPFLFFVYIHTYIQTYILTFIPVVACLSSTVTAAIQADGNIGGLE